MDENVTPEALRHGLMIGFGLWISIIGLIAAAYFIDDKVYVLLAGVILIYYRLSALQINSLLILDSLDRIKK
jgi:xanthine/uracil/vitamin C permease (AzgA family)